MSNNYFKNIKDGIETVVTGMPVTMKYFLNPKKIVTEQYPENKETLKMSERFRGQVIMPHDDEGEHNCTGCQICEKACPNGTISVLNTKSLAGKKVLGKYLYRLDQCTMCGLCVESCPFDAIHMDPKFDHSVYDKSELELTLNNKEGKS